MPNIVVGTIFKAQDRISAAFKKMAKNTKLFGRSADRAFKRANRSAKRFMNTIKALVAGAVLYKGFSLLSAGLRTATDEFIQFDQAITQAASKFPERIQRGSKEFKELGMIAREVGATTQFTAADAGRGLNNLAQAGFNAKQSMAALNGITDLATVAEIDMEEATTIATKSLGAFGLKVDDTAQLQRNLTRVNDTLAYTTTRSNTNIQQMFEALSYAGPVIKNSGQDIETFAALTGVMADGAVDASTAGTTLRSAFLRLQAPVTKARKLLKKHGIEIKDEKGNMRDFTEIITQVNIATAKMGEVQKNAFLETIFGKRAITGMSVVLAKGGEAIAKFREEIRQAGGTSKRMADDIRKSLQNRIASLQSSLIELGFRFLENFEKKGSQSIVDLTDAVRKFDVTPIVEGTTLAINAIKEIITFVNDFKDVIKAMVGIWIAFKVKAALATAGMWALNVAMAANPAGLVTAAVIALAIALGLVIGKNDELAGSWEIGMIHMEIALRQLVLANKVALNGLANAWVSQIDWIIRQANRISGIDIPEIGKVQLFDTTGDMKAIKEAERRQQDIRDEAAGVKASRFGARGRGFTGDKARRTNAMIESAFPREEQYKREYRETVEKQQSSVQLFLPKGMSHEVQGSLPPNLTIGLGGV